ncbi:MAG: hypothetical protein HYV07_09305 [Deltaproteobacteria bacterium]|nr:hypothetical protein [Deltaproteobacteria bacterium]
MPHRDPIARGGVLASAILIGCGQHGLQLQGASLAEDIEWGAVIFEQGTTWVEASDLTERRSGRFEFNAAATAPRLRFLGFRADTLREALGHLPPRGRLVPPSPDRASLPNADVALAGAADGDSLEIAADELGASAVWMPPCPLDACPLNPIGQTRVVTLPGTRAETGVAVWSEWAADRILVGLSDGALFEVSDGEATRVGRALGGPFESGGASREHMFMTSASTLLRLDRQLRTSSVALSSGDGQTDTAVSSGEGTEVFVAVGGGELFRYDGVRAERLVALGAPIENDRVAITSIGPGRAAATFMTASAIVTYEHGEVRVDRSIEHPRTVGYVPGLGVVVGTADTSGVTGRFFWMVDGAWVELSDEVFRLKLSRVWAEGGGFLFGGISGALAYYYPGLPSCPAQTYLGNSISAIARWQRGPGLPGRGRRRLREPRGSPDPAPWLHGILPPPFRALTESTKSAGA